MAPPFLKRVDRALLEKDLAGVLPEPVAPLAMVGGGFHSLVFQTASGWIVRIARTEEARERHALEAAVLPALAPRLPVAIPQSRPVLAKTPAAPFGATAYRALPGRLMTRGDFDRGAGAVLAQDLGTALAALHEIPPGVLPSAVPVAPVEHLVELRDRTLGPLQQRVSAQEGALLRDWWDHFLSSEVFQMEVRTLTHGDPWWENLLVDAGRLSGILDWEFVSWWDPANDLGVTLRMGERFFAETLAAYRAASARIDPTLERRAWLIGAVREFYGVQYAIERQDEEEWSDSLRKLRAGPLLQQHPAVW